MNPNDFYNDIILTEEEKEEALLEGRKKKWFRERHKDHWPEDVLPPKEDGSLCGKFPRIKQPKQ